jgi:hypothetical protein
MFHLNTEQLIDYWRDRRGEALIPSRSSIDPAHVLNLLPQVFMLGRSGPGQYQFRLVGDFITDLHGRDLRQYNFLKLWRSEDRTPLQMALEAVRRRGEPLVLDCGAHPEAGPAMRMEIALAPLVAANGEADRFIGLYQPITPVAALMGRPAIGLSVRAISTPGSEALPRLRLASVRGRQIA